MCKNAAVIAAVAIIVRAGEGRKDCFQLLRTQGGDCLGEPGKIRDAEHADVAGAPGLCRQPLDETADILHFEGAHELIETPGLPAAAYIENRMNVTAARKEGRIAALHI